MNKKKQKINKDDIEIRDLPRRKFLLGAGGTVIAATAALAAGCGSSSDSADTDPNIIRQDADPTDAILSNPLDLPDSD